MTLPATHQAIVRNRVTWLAYLMLAYIAISQSILGPLMPFLRSELALNYTLGGLLPAAVAIGLVFSGLVSDWLARRLSRRVVFWGGSIGLLVSVVMLARGRTFESIFFAALGMGFGSSLTQVMIQALLSDQHGEHRAIALTEANVAASLSTTLTPLIIGGMPLLGLDWRLIPLLPFLVLASLGIFFHRATIPDGSGAQNQSAAGTVRLPFTFWIYWMVLFLVVAIEMAIAVWATDFLANIVGLGRTRAALAFGAFPAAMLTGRILGSRLTQRLSSQVLLPAALAVTLIGFPVFWLARAALFNVLGLFIAGLGIANLYPLTLSMAVGMAAEQSNQASARASLAVGSALLGVPLLLGWLSDQIGIQIAYGIVVLLAMLAFVMVINNRFLIRQSQTPSPPRLPEDGKP
jgi:fucose permease